MPTRKDDIDADQPPSQRPIEERPPGDDPPPRPVRINQISPIAGILTGGIDVTLTGVGFQPEAEVYFGSSPSPEVTFVNASVVRAKTPPASQVGSVSVSLFNPDGTGATRTGGFTYVVMGTGAQAEVMGVSPLSLIEDTESEVAIRGRNLIEAYTNGMLALRGPTRANVTIANVTNSRDETTGIEELTCTVRITATPPLDPLERMAIQVLASSRPGAQNDGIVESSRQMFTVLPRSRPVPLAYSANLEPGKPNLVVIAGRNLEGCTLGLGDGATVHLQRSDDRILAGIVMLNSRTKRSVGDVPSQLSIRSADGTELAQYAVAVGEAGNVAALEGGDVTEATGDFSLSLTPVPNQQIIGPTEQDSAVFNLRGESTSSSLVFDWWNFEITILDITILLPIVHEVHLIPFFDGGGEELNDLPVLAEVGKLLRLRGVGILVALRFEIIIHIRVVLIIGFIFEIWPFGLFNEFPEYGWAIGSIVIGIRIEIEIFFIFAFLLALVLPQGRLRVLFAFNLTIGIDILISADNGEVHFGASYRVRYNRIGPFANTLLPCDGRFQLASENGQTVFTDAFGGQQSFYFPRAAGECCVPWNYELQLVRFAPGPEETVQSNFRADFCLTAAPSARLGQIIITSEHPSPTGVPPRLVLDVGQPSAALRALSLPVDANGIPTGEPAQDVRDLGYDVEFYLGSATEVVLDPTSLPLGDAFAIQSGENVIHALLIPRANEPQLFAFWPDSVLGFVISRFLAEGRAPGIQAGALPVTVNAIAGAITVELSLAYHDAQGKIVSTSDIERYEPFEPQRRYFLAAKIKIASDLSARQTLNFTVTSARLAQAPLGIPSVSFADNRGSVSTTTRFFTGALAQDNQQVMFKILNRPDPTKWTEIFGLDIMPNQAEDAALTKLVPPGKLVGNRDVVLTVSLGVTSASGARVVIARPNLNLTVRNDETFEEYMRVFKDVRTILAGTDATLTKLREFAANFYKELNTRPVTTPPAPPTAAKLKVKGTELWELGNTLAQSATKDDRPLYWARLQAIAALRAYYRRNPNLSTLPPATVDQFEWPSRGLDQARGGIIFPPEAANARKVIVTGFDPFELPSQPDQSNPSGLVALEFNGKPIDQLQPPVFVRSAVFPVRYRDFDAGLVERAMGASLGSVVLILTCSRNDSDYYDVERFASKRRLGAVDNENKGSTANVPGNREFFESTLPYEGVITSDIQTRRLDGPNRPYTPFVTDQSYKVVGASGVRQRYSRSSPGQMPPVVPGSFRPEPVDDGNVHEEAAWIKQSDVPTGVADEGSGYSYLSNEIFYRTARERDRLRPSLASGHLHLPFVSAGAKWSRTMLISGTKEALKRLLAGRFRMRSLGDITFPRTAINRTSAPRQLTAINETQETISVATVELAPPQPFSLQTTLPVAVNANSILSLSFIFAPTTLGIHNSTVTVRDAGGEVLFTARLTGEAIPLPPPPQITSFDPTSGSLDDTVTIFGAHLDGATAVRIGTLSTSFVPIDDTRIVADVAGPPRLVKIAVDTPSGTAISNALFRVIFVRPPVEDFGPQLQARRLELGVSPEDAARDIGVKSRTYKRWEQGKDRPSTRFRPGIVRFLGHDPRPAPQTLGERIRAAREREGISPPQLAERLGLSASTVRAWEAGTVKRPTPRVADVFEEYLREA